MSVSDNTKKIIVDGQMLNPDVQPGRIVVREEQISKLRRQLARANHLSGCHVWLHGPAGSGKTAMAKQTAVRISENLGVISFVNCWQNRTLHTVLQAIIYELKIFRAELQNTDLKMHRIRQTLDGHPMTVILDEIDRPMPAQRQKILYGLLQLPNVSLICIANSTQPLAALDERIRSRLDPTLIECPPYNREQLVEILTDRAEMGLASGTWSMKILRQIASAAAGDARVAINMLRQTAATAEEDGSPKIKSKHLSGLLRQQRILGIEAKLASLSEEERIIHAIAADQGPLGTLDLRHRYLDQCESLGRSPIAERTFTKYIGRLTSAGLLKVSTYPQANRGRLVQVA